MGALDKLGVPVSIYAVPSEIPDAIPFAADEVHRAYDGELAQRYWRILAQTERVFTEFRARSSSASAAPCISSGARRPRRDALSGASRRSTRVAYRTFPIA